MLTSADVSAMRAIADEFLPGTAVLRNAGTFVSDGGGGGSYSASVAGTYPCRLAPIRGDEREIGERISADADFIVTLPTTAPVTTDSTIVSGGGTFNVATIRDRDWEITQRVEVVRQT